jgi:large subunit ribosomal protein L22
MESRASARYLRGSAQKARLVVDMIRGRNVNQALAILRFANKRAADGIEACVRSAIANASEAAEKANVAVDPDDLWVKAAFIDRGPTKNRRRMRPAPQGRAYRERRHFCHVTILLSSDEKAPDGKKDVLAPAKLAESKKRRLGGAAAAPRSKRATPPASKEAKPESVPETKPKRASKKKATPAEAAKTEGEN